MFNNIPKNIHSFISNRKENEVILPAIDVGFVLIAIYEIIKSSKVIK